VYVVAQALDQPTQLIDGAPAPRLPDSGLAAVGALGCPDRRDLLAAVPLRAVAGRTPVQVFLVLAGLLFTCCLVAQGLLIGAGLAAGREKSQERASRQVAAMLLGR
jgi:hypothetical protein